MVQLLALHPYRHCHRSGLHIPNLHGYEKKTCNGFTSFCVFALGIAFRIVLAAASTKSMSPAFLFGLILLLVLAFAVASCPCLCVAFGLAIRLLVMSCLS